MTTTVPPQPLTHLQAVEELVANVVESASIGQAFWRRSLENPDVLLYRYAVAPSATATRVWKEETYASASASIARIAHHLSSLGVGVGTTVAVMSHTRPEWILVDLAVQTLGAVTVSIYQSLPAHEAGYILYDSKAAFIFVENEEQADKIAAITSAPCPIPEREGIPATSETLSIKHVVSFEPLQIKQTPSGIPITSIASIIENEALSKKPPPVPADLTRESVASIVYTSGTTGPPKGVIQSHGNHLSNVFQACESRVFPSDGSLMLYLPLAHSFARLCYYAAVLSSAQLVMPAIVDHRTSKVDLVSVARDIRESNSIVIPSVPRLFEKMLSTIQAKALGKGLQSWILRACLHNAQEVYQLKREGKIPSVIHQIIFEGMSPIRAKIKRQLFGTAFSHAISGGAKLDPSVNRFFDALGILICEGYGLTETCVATHVNRVSRRKIGTVGPAFIDLEVQIHPEDGEIVMRGPNVARGYLNRPQATAEAWTGDGWFRTGDIGSIDQDGFLSITDRKKELIVTAGGKKIPPQSIEGLFKRVPYISQPFLFGDEKPYCVMLFALNELELRQILTAKGIPIHESDVLSQVPIVKEMLSAELQRVNSQLSSFESIKNFAIVAEDFTIENGLLTPTLKVKRKKVVEKYRELIESLYRSTDATRGG